MEDDWIDGKEAARILGYHLDALRRFAKRKQMTCEQRRTVRGQPYFYLRREIEGWAEFLKLRDGYRKRHREHSGVPHVEAVSEADAIASGFLRVKEAAQVLGVSEGRVRALVQNGQLAGYQGLPGRKGSPLFVSRRATQILAEDEEHLRRRRKWEQARDTGVLVRESGRQVARPRCHPKLAEGLLTSVEAAALLGVATKNLDVLRKKGRLRGVHVLKGKRTLNRKEGKRWYYWEEEVRHLMESEGHRVQRARTLLREVKLRGPQAASTPMTPGAQWEGPLLPWPF